MGDANYMIFRAVEWVFAIMLHGSAYTMAASRLCVPCCCEKGYDNVPGCCPCNCFTQLDTIWYVMAGWSWLMGSLAWVAAHGLDISILKILRIVPLILWIATMVCSSVKLGIMTNCCCQDCAPQST